MTTGSGTLRVGVDVLDSGELRRLVERPWFLRFGFAPEELAHADTLAARRRLEFLAGRFAAKEAVLKVLGVGLLQGVAPREIWVEQTAAGAPRVHLRERAAGVARCAVSVSITHKHDVVAAVAVGVPPPVGGADRHEPAAPREAKESPAVTAQTVPSPADTRREVGDDTEITALLRVRIGRGEAHYGGDLVDGARILRLFGDLVTEITIRTDGDEGLLAEYTDVRFTEPVRPGDYIEARARLVRRTRLRRVVELEARKVIGARADGRGSAATVLDGPRLVCTATATTVVPYRSAGPVPADDARVEET